MLSKYYAAQRRMEAAAKQMEGLQKKLKKQSGDAKQSEETRRELNRLREMMRQAAGEIRKSANAPLPYDLDKNLSSECSSWPTRRRKWPRSWKSSGGADLLNKKLGGKLDELAKKLSQGRKLFDERAVEPMELFAQVFSAAGRPAALYHAGPVAAGFGRTIGVAEGARRRDNPALKARMRDLEQEQRQIREALSTFLEGMEEHIAKLPRQA